MILQKNPSAIVWTHLSTAPKPTENCRFENHGFVPFLGVFSFGMSARVSSFLK